MRRAREIVTKGVVCPPHRGYSWSHRPRSRATLAKLGRKAKGRAKCDGKRRNSAAKGIIKAGVSFEVSRPSAIMPREGAARERRSEIIRALLIVVVKVAGLVLLFLIPFLDLP